MGVAKQIDIFVFVGPNLSGPPARYATEILRISDHSCVVRHRHGTNPGYASKRWEYIC